MSLTIVVVCCSDSLSCWPPFEAVAACDRFPLCAFSWRSSRSLALPILPSNFSCSLIMCLQTTVNISTFFLSLYTLSFSLYILHMHSPYINIGDWCIWCITPPWPVCRSAKACASHILNVNCMCGNFCHKGKSFQYFPLPYIIRVLDHDRAPRCQIKEPIK